MNRKEAIERLKNIRNVSSMFIDEVIKDLVEVFEKPITFTDLLGWEEGVEYKYSDIEFKIEDGKLLHFSSSSENWKVVDLNWTDANIKNLQEAKKIEKLKAYHVKDEYSYKCLMEELEEQEYKWFGGTPTACNNLADYEESIVIYCEEDKLLRHSDLTFYKNARKDDYDLIEYHKEEPRVYAKVKGTNIYLRNVAGCKVDFKKADWAEIGIDDSNVDWEFV